MTTLVDEEKPAGRYEARWDAGGFASGVYFYRLQAGEFVGMGVQSDQPRQLSGLQTTFPETKESFPLMDRGKIILSQSVVH